MKTKVDNVQENAATPFAKSKRTARACEVAIRQEADRTAVADDKTGLTLAMEQSQRPVERLLPPQTESPSTILALIEKLALDPGADVEKLDRMMAMYERLKAERGRAQ